MQDVASDTNEKNMKNIVFHMTFGKYLKLGTSENIQT